MAQQFPLRGTHHKRGLRQQSVPDEVVRPMAYMLTARPVSSSASASQPVSRPTVLPVVEVDRPPKPPRFAPRPPVVPGVDVDPQQQSARFVSDGLNSVRKMVHSEVLRLEHESACWGPNDTAVLELHRESFARLIGSFRAYSSILTNIKVAYDHAIDSRMQKIFVMQPKVTKLDAMQNGYGSEVQALYEAFQNEAQPLRDDLQHMRAYNVETDDMIEAKMLQIQQDTVLVEQEQQKKNEQEEWHHTLVQSMKQWERKLEQMHAEADTLGNSVWHTKQEITKTKDKIEIGIQNKARKSEAIERHSDDVNINTRQVSTP
jgi:hypothetical protein